MNKEIVCAKCNSDPLCPVCHPEAFNRPLVVKYIDQEMPLIIHRCAGCNIELFRSIMCEMITLFRSYCLMCANLGNV